MTSIPEGGMLPEPRSHQYRNPVVTTDEEDRAYHRWQAAKERERHSRAALRGAEREVQDARRDRISAYREYRRLTEGMTR